MVHDPRKITVHCSASKNGKKYPIELLRKFHIEHRGFADVGYHLVIQPDGSVDVGRDELVVGAHVKDHNRGNIGICLVGTDRFSLVQFVSLRDEVSRLVSTHDIDPWDVFCHYEFDSARAQGKTCPNIPARNILAYIMLGDIEAVSSFLGD